MNSGVYIALFLWTSSTESAFVLYICVGIFALGFPVYSTVLSCKYNKQIPQKRSFKGVYTVISMSFFPSFRHHVNILMLY